jgi:DNA repair protein RAD5
MRQVCDHPLLVLGKTKATDASENTLDLKDGPIQFEELMAKFSSGDQNEPTFGANVLQNLMSNSGDNPECPVCFEDMADGVLMPCMHAACRSCVLDYLQVRAVAGTVTADTVSGRVGFLSPHFDSNMLLSLSMSC